MSKEAKDFKEYYLKKLTEYVPEYFQDNMEDLMEISDQSDEAILFRTTIKIANEYAEQQAKAFAEYCEKYVATIEDMVNGTAKDMRNDPLREMDSEYYNFDKKQWAKDIDELYQQFKQQK